MKKIIKLETTIMIQICGLWGIFGVLVGTLGSVSGFYTVNSYHVVDIDVYPSSGVWEVFEKIRTVVECGVTVGRKPRFFYNKETKICASASPLDPPQLVVSPGFFYYQLNGEFGIKGVVLISDATLLI